MSDEEEHLSREELVEREHQARLRDYEELQRLIEERCREAEARWRSTHPWLALEWCVTVPVRWWSSNSCLDRRPKPTSAPMILFGLFGLYMIFHFLPHGSTGPATRNAWSSRWDKG